MYQSEKKTNVIITFASVIKWSNYVLKHIRINILNIEWLIL